MTGLFVTFEGGDGSGKSTQIARLAERMRVSGLDPLVLREPGGTPLGEGIRALLLDPDRDPVPLAEALLMEAARAQLCEVVIAPALAAGRVVLCDRFADSTIAYQGAGRGLDEALLAAWNRAATRGSTPDLTLLFDLPVDQGLGRRGRDGRSTNRLDREPPEFHERVRARYLALSREHPDRVVVVDAALPAEELERRVWSVVEPRLARLPRSAR